MQLYFIRHGQSANNLRYEQTLSSAGRVDDPELTETGHLQAQCLARLLSRPGVDRAINYDEHNIRGFGLTHIYCSLLVRAIDTASYVSKALQLPLVGLESIHEAGGVYLDDPETGEPHGKPGKSRAYLAERFPHLTLPDEMHNDGWWNCRPRETSPQAAERASRVLAWLLETHGGTDHRVALVSHAAFSYYFFCAVLKIPYENGPWIGLGNTCITRYDFLPEEVRVVYVNRGDHLPPELVT
ncbi:MAG TPA: histidine phosphatase family protein [Anaerolineaceae bacterium]|nr:histidine phosphatase family protein [Anaerolineaceae bacterium]HPN53919.1 histidine phosphatase family protein [Anaerolineaceae bacterium]